MTERNNLDRTGLPQSPDPSPPQALNQQMQFTVPTEFVDLPSGGKFYPEGHPLHGKDKVEIKYMTAKEEDILASQALISSGVVFDRLLRSVVMEDVDPDDLLVGDKNAILIASRVTGYGSDYLTEVTCPACKQRSKFNFNLSEARRTKQVDSDEYDKLSVQPTGNGTFTINLEEMNVVLEVKPLYARD